MTPERNAISPIVELLDVIATYAEFLQADGQDMFHVKALADDLRPFLPTQENVECPKCPGVKRVCLNGHPHTDCPWTVDCPVCTENVDSPTPIEHPTNKETP